jgi:hypothetical protein
LATTMQVAVRNEIFGACGIVRNRQSKVPAANHLSSPNPTKT